MPDNEQILTSIDWSQEPANDRERRIRAAMIRRAEERVSSRLLPDDHWMQLSALESLAGDVAKPASDLTVAIARRRALHREHLAAKRSAENAVLLAQAIADVDNAQGT